MDGETLETRAPRSGAGLTVPPVAVRKNTDVILAALFMVLANRYDWRVSFWR